MVGSSGVAHALDELFFVHICGGAVCDNEAYVPLLKELHGGLAVLCRDDLMRIGLQYLLDDCAFHPVFVEDEDLHMNASLLPSIISQTVISMRVRVKSNDNVTEQVSFYQKKML